MIKAINKAGLVSTFTEKVWNMMSKNHNGFIELTEADATVVPKEIIEFQSKKVAAPIPEIKEMKLVKPVVETVRHNSDAAAEMDIMRAFLKSKDVKVHPMLGYDKLKKLYDAHKK